MTTKLDICGRTVEYKRKRVRAIQGSAHTVQLSTQYFGHQGRHPFTQQPELLRVCPV